MPISQSPQHQERHTQIRRSSDDPLQSAQLHNQMPRPATSDKLQKRRQSDSVVHAAPAYHAMRPSPVHLGFSQMPSPAYEQTMQQNSQASAEHPGFNQMPRSPGYEQNTQQNSQANAMYAAPNPMQQNLQASATHPGFSQMPRSPAYEQMQQNSQANATHPGFNQMPRSPAYAGCRFWSQNISTFILISPRAKMPTYRQTIKIRMYFDISIFLAKFVV